MSGAGPASDDPLTAAACGILAASLAALCHETIGHGLACHAEGGRLTLLTSIWFRCSGATSLTYAAGPAASLAGGLIGLAALHRSRSAPLRLFLVLFTAFRLFWFAGQLVSQPITGKDIWAIIAARLQWPAAWQSVAILLGVVTYVAAMRRIAASVRAAGPRRHAIVTGYAAGTVSAVAAGLMWAAMPARSAIEALQTLGIAPLGLIAIAAMAPNGTDGTGEALVRSNRLIALSIALFLIFILIQGRGLGELSGTALSL